MEAEAAAQAVKHEAALAMLGDALRVQQALVHDAAQAEIAARSVLAQATAQVASLQTAASAATLLLSDWLEDYAGAATERELAPIVGPAMLPIPQTLRSRQAGTRINCAPGPSARLDSPYVGTRAVTGFSAWELARLQFAVTRSFHILFPA